MTLMDFVFMLTRNDETVANARQLVPAIVEAGVRHVGCKDVGLPIDEVALLFGELRSAGCVTYLEAISTTPEANVASAQAALTVRPDHFIGGTERVSAAAILAGSGIRHWPYVGAVVGHPCLLRGTQSEIVADARLAQVEGADGINLLAYRWDGEPEILTATVVEAMDIPVLVAGSIDSAARIAAVRSAGAAAFTIGTAVLDGVIGPDLDLSDRLRSVVAMAS